MDCVEIRNQSIDGFDFLSQNFTNDTECKNINLQRVITMFYAIENTLTTTFIPLYAAFQ